MLIVANWKMNLSLKDAEALTVEFINLSTTKNEVVIAPPFTHIDHISNIILNSNIKLAGQNCYFEETGAFTGEISPLMLKEFGCEYVILGHSERRSLFNESDEIIHKKSSAVQKFGLKPIICIGETLEQREAGRTNEILTQQIENSIPKTFSSDDFIVAYEPVWAIGTGKVASLDDIEKAHAHIVSLVGENTAILYGGSVNDDNCSEIAKVPLVGGMLVGGASLRSNKFSVIMNV